MKSDGELWELTQKITGQLAKDLDRELTASGRVLNPARLEALYSAWAMEIYGELKRNFGQ